MAIIWPHEFWDANAFPLLGVVHCIDVFIEGGCTVYVYIWHAVNYPLSRIPNRPLSFEPPPHLRPQKFMNALGA